MITNETMTEAPAATQVEPLADGPVIVISGAPGRHHPARSPRD